MSAIAVMSPAAKKRLAVFESMAPPVQALAKYCETEWANAASNMIVHNYNIGARLMKAIEDEKEFKHDVIPKLMSYFGFTHDTALYQLRNFAVAFDKKNVQALSAKPLADGSFLCLAHWLELTSIDDVKTQKELLDKTFKNAWSANELRQEIKARGARKNSRQGGRKPLVPSSPVAGLIKTFELAQRFNNYGKEAEDPVFLALTKIAPDKVSDELLKRTVQTKDELDNAVAEATRISDSLEVSIDRFDEILGERRKKAAENTEDETDETDDAEDAVDTETEAPSSKKRPRAAPGAADTETEAPSSKKRPRAAPGAANGKPANHKHKPSRRPAAATV